MGKGMERLWQNGFVRNESGMFAGNSQIKLMFPAESITQVTQHSSGEIFEVFALAQEDFEIGHAVSNTGRDYDEVCENLFEIREEF